jgi:hypothetical protein
VRGVVDLPGPGGVSLPAIGTSHLRDIMAPDDSIMSGTSLNNPSSK